MSTIGRRLGPNTRAPRGTPEGYSPVVSATGEIIAWVLSGVPTYIGPTETFTVPVNTQALFALTIDNEGIIDLVGDLVMVD